MAATENSTNHMNGNPYNVTSASTNRMTPSHYTHSDDVKGKYVEFLHSSEENERTALREVSCSKDEDTLTGKMSE